MQLERLLCLEPQGEVRPAERDMKSKFAFEYVQGVLLALEIILAARQNGTVGRIGADPCCECERVFVFELRTALLGEVLAVKCALVVDSKTETFAHGPVGRNV